MSNAPTQAARPIRNWLWWVNLALGTLGVLALAGMANYFSHRHHHRARMAERLDTELSPLTLQVLQSVTNPVRVIVFYDRRESLYRPVIEMLRQYEEINPHLNVESVDYEREPIKARRVQKELRLAGSAKDLVIFHANKKTQMIPHGALSGLTAAPIDKKGRPVFKRTRFNGEQMFTSALVAVSDSTKPVVYYLAENGTHAFNESTRHDDSYGKFARMLSLMNVDARPLSLSERAVPADCQLLIVPGPSRQLDALSISRLHDHLSDGGRQLILFRQNTRADLGPFLSAWGVQVGNDEANDPGNSFEDDTYKFSKFDTDKEHGVHLAMRTLHRGNLSLRMARPRSVTDRKSSPAGGDTVRRTVLVSTGRQGLTYLRTVPDVPRSQQQVGLRGYIPVAMAVERDPPAGVENAEVVRLVVMGDSSWLSNALYDHEGNEEMSWHLVNWLLDRSHLLAIGPRPIKVYQFSMTRKNRRDLAGWLLGIVPGGIMGLGLMVWLRRRY